MSIVVSTPTGNIGKVVTERLLEEGADVTLIARDPDKVSEFASRGARVVQGSLDDEALVKEATRGAEALFWVTPPNFATDDFRAFQNKVGRAGAAAVRANSIPHVVNISSIGAQHGENTGPINGLHDVEKMFSETGQNVVHLRAGFFMENYLPQVPTIASMGSVFMPCPGEIRLSMVATRDIGRVAAARLLDRDWTGQFTQGVHGPVDLSFDEAAVAIGEGLGREVKHVMATMGQAREAMAAMGMSAGAVDTLLELYDGFNKGYCKPEEPRTAETTTSTTLAAFAGEVLSPAVEAHLSP